MEATISNPIYSAIVVRISGSLNESKYSSGYPVSSKANGKMAEATHAAMRARPQSTNPPPVWKAEFEVWVLTKGGLVCVIMQTDTIP